MTSWAMCIWGVLTFGSGLDSLFFFAIMRASNEQMKTFLTTDSRGSDSMVNY